MTQRINAQARVHTDIEFTGERVLMPGAPDEFGLTARQYGTIRTFATTELISLVKPDAQDPTVFIADALPRWSTTMAALRSHFRTTRDYDLVGKIQLVWEDRRKDTDVSTAQFNYAMDLVGYLTDPSSANDRVAAALRELPDDIRNTLRLRGISISTMGDFSKFRTVFWKMVPRETEAGRTLRQEMAGTQMAEDQLPLVDPPPSGDERY